MKCQFCEAEAAYRLDLGKQYPKSKEHGGVVGRCVKHLAPWNRTIAEPIHDANYPPVVEDAALEEPERPAPPEDGKPKRKPRKKASPAAAEFDPA